MRKPCFRLVKALYGHPESGAHWENHLRGIITKKRGEAVNGHPSTYWFPLLEMFGNRPVWSVAMIPVGLTAIVLKLTKFAREAGVASVILTLVLRVCCLVIRECPIVVGTLFSKYFRTAFEVRPGKVARKPASIASQIVVAHGDHSDLW